MTSMAKDRPDIFQYVDGLSYLRDFLKWRQEHDHRLSLRKVAQSAGYKSHSQLSRVLRGQAPLDIAMAQKLGTALNVTETEFRRLTTLVAGDDTTTVDTFQLPQLETVLVDMLVVALMQHEGSGSTGDWFSGFTRGLLAVGEVDESISRLQAAGVARWTDHGWQVDESLAAATWVVSPGETPRYMDVCRIFLNRYLGHQRLDSQTTINYLYLTEAERAGLSRDLQQVLYKKNHPERHSGTLHLVGIIVGQLGRD